MAGAVPPHRCDLWDLLIHSPSGKILWGKGIRGNWEGLGLPEDAVSRCDQRWGRKWQWVVASPPKQVPTGGFPSPSDPHGGVLSLSQIFNIPQALEDQKILTLGCHLCPRMCPTS